MINISKRRCVTILIQHGLLHINKMGKSIKKMQLKKLCRLITVMKECETIEDLNDREKNCLWSFIFFLKFLLKYFLNSISFFA